MLRLSRREEDFDSLRNRALYTLDEFLVFLAEKYKELPNHVYKDMVLGNLIKEYPLTQSLDEIVDRIHALGYNFLIPAFLRAFNANKEQYFKIMLESLMQPNAPMDDYDNYFRDIHWVDFLKYLENYIETSESFTFDKACILLENLIRSNYYTQPINAVLKRFKSDFENEPRKLYEIALLHDHGYMLLNPIGEVFGDEMFDKFLSFASEETSYKYEGLLFSSIQWIFDYCNYEPSNEFLEKIIENCKSRSLLALLRFYKKKPDGED